jgi:hypothetical protein
MVRQFSDQPVSPESPALCIPASRAEVINYGRW